MAGGKICEATDGPGGPFVAALHRPRVPLIGVEHSYYI